MYIHIHIRMHIHVHKYTYTHTLKVKKPRRLVSPVAGRNKKPNQTEPNLLWVLGRGGCSRRWVVLYNKTAYNII